MRQAGKEEKLKKHIECQEQVKLVEKIRQDRPGKNLGPGKKKNDPVTPGRAVTHGPGWKGACRWRRLSLSA